VAVHDLAAARADAVRPAARTANDDVGVDARTPEGERQEWERQPVTPPKQRRAVEPERAHVAVTELRESRGRVVERRVYGCVRKCAAERKDDALGAAALGQVVVDERHPRVRCRSPGLHASQPRLDHGNGERRRLRDEMTRDARRERRLRVVFVDHVARLSGGEIALLRLLPALARDVDVHVILGEEGPLDERLRSQGISVEVLPLAPALRDLGKDTLGPRRLDLSTAARAVPYVPRLGRRIRAHGADLVHTNSLKAALYGGAAGRFARVPVIWHVRDRIADDYLPHSAVLLVRAAARLLPTAVVANSQTTLDTVPRARRGRVVQNPIVPDAVDGPPPAAPRAHAGTTVGIVGRLAPWKGQDVFLDAFAQAFRDTGVRGRVIGSALFGEDAYRQQLAQQAERIGIADQIEFRGFRENVWAELAELDVLVHCSVIPEPFGQVVLEGMAAGLPVVAANAGGPAELITNGVDGILTPPGDAHELAEALRHLERDATLRATLGSAAARRSEEFRPERSAAKLLAIYREVLPP